jgi:lipopolysaccharide transport system ATP-binding protein
MDNYAITLDNVSKKYNIGASRALKETFKETLTRMVLSPFKKMGGILRGEASAASSLEKEFWALRDISLNIRTGETVGLVGSNGAGKSTLLKVLTRITQPTSGYGEINGRTGALLEVGTGFHPELTGRDNIFLNGSILGMSQSIIKSKFDEIVDFSGVEEFLDTPVKHYSSGMYVRLAFAVAANLEPEVLLVDEVLAVGDASFQKKCMSKMNAIGDEGRTIVFVSHNMGAITRLCKRAILLKDGQIIDDGPAADVVAKYMTSGISKVGSRDWYNETKKFGDEIVQLLAIRVRDKNGAIIDTTDIRNPVVIEMEFEVMKDGYNFLPHFHLFNEAGINMMTIVDLDKEWQKKVRPKGIYRTSVIIKGNLFSECTVFIHANMLSLNPLVTHFSAPDVVAFQVFDTLEGDSARGEYGGPLKGIVRPAFEWQTEYKHSN